jgi:hypothetical protein
MTRPIRVATPARAAALWLAVGLVEAVVWPELSRVFVGWSDASYEHALSGDVAFAGMQLVVGLVAAVVGLVVAGRGSALRFVFAAVGSGLAGLVGWGGGRLLGAPVLHLVAVLAVAPLVLGLVTVIGTLVATITVRDPYAT